jgi:CubicO group peptidase (beta-lactamase class C family)
VVVPNIRTRPRLWRSLLDVISTSQWSEWRRATAVRGFGRLGSTAIVHLVVSANPIRVRRIVSVIAVVLAGLCAGCQTGRALKGTIPASELVGLHDERIERIGEAVRQTMRKEGIPGCSVAVIDHGEVVWAQGFGWRDVARRLPVEADTQFQAGSISKAVTALGVLQLEGSGKVCLDADVNLYHKGWRLESRFTNTITLRQLLCHRAGMVPHGFLGSGEHAMVLSTLQVLKRHKPVVSCLTGHYLGTIKVAKPPGSEYNYSGGGYCVVQKAVEDVTGQPFEVAMDNLVLQPVGMSRSTFQQPPQDTNHLARGYGWMMNALGGGRWRVFPEKAPAGLWTTPRDLARFAVAIQKAAAGTATPEITPAIVREYLKPQFDEWQGIGIRLGRSDDGYRVFYHYGENPGYCAALVAGTSIGRGFVIMTNANKHRLTPIMKAIAHEFGWTPNR